MTSTNRLLTLAALTIAALAVASACPGGDLPHTKAVRFPADAGVVDVTQPPYHAKGDGKADDTDAIQRALDNNPSADRIIYLPDGTYRITDTLRWPAGPHGGVAQKRVILQGQSTTGTVIRIDDGAAGFNNASRPKALIWCGKKPAQRFRNGIRTLTVHTGRNNPGAIGVQYIANNQGSMRYVHIISEDGRGKIGLDLGYTDEQGPCLIKHVYVKGYEIGVSARTVVDSITMEYVTVEDQSDVGVRNEGQCVSIRKLTSRNRVPAVENLTLNSLMTLIDCELVGKGPAARTHAVENSGGLFCRDVRVTGYAVGVRNTTKSGTGRNAPAGRIREFVSHEVETLFETDETSLRLPVKETPEADNYDLSSWASPAQFGGDPTDKKDDSAAVQKAIDSGAKVIYFPYAEKGKWLIESTVLVRGEVERITALEGRLGGKGTLKIVDGGSSDTVMVDRMDWIYQHLNLHQASRRTLVLSGVTLGRGEFITDPGCGDIFLEDVVGHGWKFRNCSVWGRQVNNETRDRLKIANAGGNLWILGLKTENAGTLVETTDGGRTEILGGFCYAQGRPKTTPMFVVEDASLSLSIGESTWNNRNFKVVVEQTLDDRTRKVGRINWRANNASSVPLFIARHE